LINILPLPHKKLLMVSFPNAKINIGLNITEKRPDGYHNIETIFYPIGLCDKLSFEIAKGDETSLSISGIKIDGDPNDNLIIRAYNLLKNNYYLPSLNIFLEKNIPFGAGLGGGSADAAFMLKMLNEEFNLNLTPIDLEKFAAELGADCPFFVLNKPVFASGIGNVFSNINISIKGYYIVLIKPNVYVSTSNAYSGVKVQKSAFSLLNLSEKSISEWKDIVVNDFEKSIFLKFPAIAAIKETLYQQGALYASMSGSGSSVYGIFDKKVDVSTLFQDSFVWADFLQ